MSSIFSKQTDEARQVADFVMNNFFERRMGVLPWPNGMVLFANLGWDDRSKHVLECVFKFFDESLDEFSFQFGLNTEEEYTWALILQPVNNSSPEAIRYINQLMQNAWVEACSSELWKLPSKEALLSQEFEGVPSGEWMREATAKLMQNSVSH